MMYNFIKYFLILPILFLGFLLIKCGNNDDSDVKLCKDAMEAYCKKGFECNINVPKNTTNLQEPYYPTEEECKTDLKTMCEQLYNQSDYGEEFDPLNEKQAKQCIEDLEKLTCEDLKNGKDSSACPYFYEEENSQPSESSEISAGSEEGSLIEETSQ